MAKLAAAAAVEALARSAVEERGAETLGPVATWTACVGTAAAFAVVSNYFLVRSGPPLMANISRKLLP
jgi:hypothetical protein